MRKSSRLVYTALFTLSLFMPLALAFAQTNPTVSTSIQNPDVPLIMGQFQRATFERWLQLGSGVQKLESRPTVVEWIEMRQKHEPEYRGRTLKQWLEDAAPVPSNQATVEDYISARDQCEYAIHTIGSNAIPWLMAWLQSTNEQYALARRGFGILQGDAAPAIPALAQMTETNLPSLRSQAYSCLKGLSLEWTNAWVALVPVLHNPDPKIRGEAVSFLYQNFPKEAERAGLREFVSARFAQ